SGTPSLPRRLIAMRPAMSASAIAVGSVTKPPMGNSDPVPLHAPGTPVGPYVRLPIATTTVLLPGAMKPGSARLYSPAAFVTPLAPAIGETQTGPPQPVRPKVARSTSTPAT